MSWQVDYYQVFKNIVNSDDDDVQINFKERM